MKNAMLLVGTWLGILLFTYALVFLPGGRLPLIGPAADVDVVDESQGWTIPVPVGWYTRSIDAAHFLFSPVVGVDVWAVSVPATDAEEALSEAWDVVIPCSSCERSPITESSPAGSGREGVTFRLGPDGEGRTGLAVVLAAGDASRVLLVRWAPEAELPERVEGDLSRIVAGFRALPAAPAEAPEA